MKRCCCAAIPRELDDTQSAANDEDFYSIIDPRLLGPISKMEDAGSSAEEHTISLYEVLACVYGRNIVPLIDNIMVTVVKTITSSPRLHQACAKVVSAVARYGIDPSTPNHERIKIVHSLCKPLSEILMGFPQNAASGAALCLIALVDSDNWLFASDEVVNNVCLRVTCALEEKLTQTISHMGLAMALGKHNSLTVEGYTRSILRSGIDILTAERMNGNSNSQKRFSAIQMIHFLMECIDARSFISELPMIVNVIEQCQLDQVQVIRDSAFKTLQTARRITDEGLTFENSLSMIIDTNFRNLQHAGQSLRFGSPESRTIHSIVESDSISLLSIGQASSNQKMSKFENGGVDASLEHGFTAFKPDCDCSTFLSEQFKDGEGNHRGSDYGEEFSEFADASPAETMTRSATPSPQTLQSHINKDNVRKSPTRRQLSYTLERVDNNNAEIFEQLSGNIGLTPCEVVFGASREEDRRNISPTFSSVMMHELSGKGKNRVAVSERRRGVMLAFSFISMILVLLLIFPVLISLMLSEHQNGCFNLIPT